MLISKAHATAMDAAATGSIALADAPSATEAFAWNMGLVLVLVVLFYVLMILPQQRRFKEHSAMLSQLKKGDKVVTGGGFIGKIDKIVNDEEVLIDLGNGLKVTALRSTIHAKNDHLLKSKPANDAKPSDKKKSGDDDALKDAAGDSENP
jgi:preprotein translocase subunit YajC